MISIPSEVEAEIRNSRTMAPLRVISENLGAKVEAPANYSWTWIHTLDTPGFYYKEGQYDFLNLEGNSLNRFDIYTLIKSFTEETLEGYPETLIHDSTENQWYLFSEKAR